jgi:rubrerythrin
MILNLFEPGGTPLDQQRFTWKDLVREPISKLDDDAFTRVRVILMNGIEQEALRFSHMMSRQSPPALREALAQVRRTEHFQATTINWLLGADHSPLETTIAYEQVAIEVTAALARKEPDPYVAQVLRFGLLEDFDHLYRYSALLDRLEGKDANNILQGYTDIVPGRPTIDEHRAPEDDLREPYRRDADPLSKMHAITITAGEAQTQNYYLNIGPLFADPVARQLYAEIAAIEEQHVTQYGSLLNPGETWLEQWVLHEANEVYCYASCVESETNPRIKQIWQRFLDYELGHLAVAEHWFKEIERRDPAEILPTVLPGTIEFASQREFVRKVLREEVNLRASGTQFVPREQEPPRSREYRRQVNSQGSPSNTVAAGYRWSPGTELARQPELSTIE